MGVNNIKTANDQLLRIDLESYKKMDKTRVALVLDDIRSGLNIGSIFRSADAFLVNRIYLCGICATPPAKEILKTALGATESVDWQYGEQATVVVGELIREGWKIVALEQTRKSIHLSDFSPLPDEKYAIVVGNEVAGVRQEIIDQCSLCIEIPQAGTKHSLNVAVATGILLWDIFSKVKRS